jgi:hypothetical protein
VIEGLDHTYKCGDVMSYFLDRCGPRKILDVDMPCGENAKRLCGDGARTQNSFRKLAAAVGLRDEPDPEPEPEPEPDTEVEPETEPEVGPQDPYADSDSDSDGDDDDNEWSELEDGAILRGSDGFLYRVHRVRQRGRTVVVMERIGRARPSRQRRAN